MTQTILITGASSGYGRATAQHFLDCGWNVAAAMRKPDAALFQGALERLRIVRMDVTDEASIESALDAAEAAFGGVDVLVNNAGIGLLSAFEATPQSMAREIFETNTFGVMNVCRAAIPRLRKQGRGTIVNVTSSTGMAPMPLVAIYSASKWAIEGFSESLAYEMARVGVRVRIVEPGLGPTTSFGANSAHRLEGLTPEPYGAFARAYFERVRAYPTNYTSETEVAHAVWRAATEPGDRLRYPAGADAELVANLRWGNTEEAFLARIRELFVPA